MRLAHSVFTNKKYDCLMIIEVYDYLKRGHLYYISSTLTGPLHNFNIFYIINLLYYLVSAIVINIVFYRF